MKLVMRICVHEFVYARLMADSTPLDGCSSTETDDIMSGRAHNPEQSRSHDALLDQRGQQK